MNVMYQSDEGKDAANCWQRSKDWHTIYETQRMPLSCLVNIWRRDVDSWFDNDLSSMIPDSWPCSGLRHEVVIAVPTDCEITTFTFDGPSHRNMPHDYTSHTFTVNERRMIWPYLFSIRVLPRWCEEFSRTTS